MIDPIQLPHDPFADVDRLGDEIAELSAHIQAATYRLLVMIREFDTRNGWQDTLAEQRRVDALELMAESALEGGLDPGTAGDHYQVVVQVQDDVSAETQRRKDESTPPRSEAAGLMPSGAGASPAPTSTRFPAAFP